MRKGAEWRKLIENQAFRTILGFIARTIKVIEKTLKAPERNHIRNVLSDLWITRNINNNALSTLFARSFLPKGNTLDGQRRKIREYGAYVLNHNILRNDR